MLYGFVDERCAISVDEVGKECFGRRVSLSGRMQWRVHDENLGGYVRYDLGDAVDAYSTPENTQYIVHFLFPRVGCALSEQGSEQYVTKYQGLNERIYDT